MDIKHGGKFADRRQQRSLSGRFSPALSCRPGELERRRRLPRGAERLRCADAESSSPKGAKETTRAFDEEVVESRGFPGERWGANARGGHHLDAIQHVIQLNSPTMLAR